MDIDDLKDVWKKSGTKLGQHDTEERDRLLKIISASGKRIKRSFLIDIAVGAILYLLFLLIVLIFGSKIQSFLYKLVIVTLVFTLPIYYRMFKSINFLKQMDYSKDLRTTLFEFLMHYKTSVQFYRWGTYFLVVAVLIIFFNDTSFLALTTIYKSVIIGYLILVMIIIGPVVSWVYGRRIREIQSQLKED